MENPRRAGKCYKACCPLPGHHERTPSFYYYPDGGYWCFGCQRGGKDVISFAFHYWELSYPSDFPQALEKLGARISGGTLAQTRTFLPPAPKAATPRPAVWPALPNAATLAVYRVAAELWQRNLWTPTGRDALAYLRGRGLPDEIIAREGIGFASDTLAEALRRRGLALKVAQEAGLLRASGHEVFTGRVVLWEWRRVAGIRTPVWATARTCSAGAAWDDAPKYLNVRGDRLLGGLESALGQPAVALVEGAFDRLAVLALGDPAVFMGSNEPSEAILAEIRRLAQRAVLYLIRDRDRAGRRGCWSTIYRLNLPPAARLILVDLPRGVKDPGQLAERSDGAALYQAAKRQGRVLDLERFTGRCERFHALVERRRAAAPPASTPPPALPAPGHRRRPRRQEAR
jgi:DNA primase